MAVAFDGFSIREYASKMRTVDVAKCWPFDGESDDIRKEDIEAFLPPIMVTKFRWWSDELGFVQLNEERPVIFGESSKSGNVEVALSDKIDFDCTTERGNEVKSPVKMKTKSRAPKKRSIVEIFAVAPQVERVDEKDENEDSPEDEVHNSKVLALCDVSSHLKNKDKMKKMKKDPKLKDETIGSLKMQKKMIKVKNKNKGRDSIAKKEKPHKLKLQSRIGFTSKPNISLYSEGSTKVILDDVSILKKKPTVKCLATQKKKLGKTSKLVKHQKPVFHVCGILKNRRKGFSQEHFALCNAQIVSQLDQHSIPQSVRHVTFSDMNDTLGPGRKTSLVCPKLPTFSSSNFNGIPDASAEDHEMERGKNLAIPEVNDSDEEDVSLTKKIDTEIQPSSTRESFGIQNFLNPPPCHQEQLSEGSVTVNHVATSKEKFRTSKQGYRDGSYDPSYDRLIALHSRDLTQTAAAAAACSTAYVQSFSHPSSSYVAVNENENGKLLFTPQNPTVNYPNDVMQYQSSCHLTPKELMHSLHSFPEWKQRAVMGEGKCVDQGFFGLPLNSQGELIQLNSNGAVTGSCCLDLSEERNNNGGAPTKAMSNVFRDWNGMNENDNFPVSSRIGKSRIQGIDVRCFNPVLEPNHSLFHPESDLWQLKNTCHGHKQYNQVQNQIAEGKGFQQGNPNDMTVHVTRPTMRLMGKEFTVGRSSKDLQAFEDGKVWTDKQIIAEHRPSDTSIGSSTLQQPFIVSGENVPYLSEFQIYQAPQSGLKMKPPASRFSHPYHAHGNRVSTLHPYTCSSVSPPLFTPAPLFHDPLTVAYESPKTNSRIPTFASTPLGYTSHLTSKSADKSRKKLPHATKSTVEFPFLHPDSGEHVRPSWLQNPSTSLPPWLSGTQQNGTPIGSFYSYSDVGGRNHPSTMYGSTFQPYPYNPAFPVSAVENSFRPPLMPQCHDFIPIPSVSKVRGERMKFKERVVRRVSVKEPSQGKKTRKRPASKTSSYSPKLTKVPNFTVEEESGADTILKASMTAHELDSITDKAGTTKCGETQIRITDGIGKAGPTRLSAGAKHILKPRSDTDQDNSRPTVSSISFVASTSSGRISESENKSAQIYRF